MPGTIGKVLGVLVSHSGPTVYGLVYGQAGTLITQATIASIAYTVSTVAADGTEAVVGTGSLSVAGCVFDTPITTDPRYTLAGGYNFRAPLPSTLFVTRGARVRIDIDFTPSSPSEQPFRQIYEGTLL